MGSRVRPKAMRTTIIARERQAITPDKPVLNNARDERFAQELARGDSHGGVQRGRPRHASWERGSSGNSDNILGSVTELKAAARPRTRRPPALNRRYDPVRAEQPSVKAMLLLCKK